MRVVWLMRSGILAWGLLALLPSTAAQAQTELRQYDPERFRPGLGVEAFLGIDTARVPGPMQWDAGWLVDIQARPLRREGNSEGLIAHRFRLTAFGSLSLGGVLQLGLDLPVVLSQGRRESVASPLGLGSLAPAGLGDLRISPKLRLLYQEKFGIDLAVVPRLRLPTQVPRNDYLGSAWPVFAPELIASRRFGALEGTLSVGVRVQQGLQSTLNRYGSEFFSNFGLRYRVSTLPLSIRLALATVTRASSPFASGADLGMELRTGASYVVAKALNLDAGLGVGLSPYAGVPDFRFWIGGRYAPRKRDADIDGVLDADDNCPTQPEDLDGYLDEDGCPDLDNDRDGVNDFADGAPNEPEDVDGYADLDGIPDPDNDEDGLADADDQCPLAAEDLDSFADDDGCPEPDNDGDGINDNEDLCPNRPEDLDQFGDDDGCPELDNDGDGVEDAVDTCPGEKGLVDYAGCLERQPVWLGHEQLEFAQAFTFPRGSSELSVTLQNSLRAVVALLARHPGLRLRIDVHTDNVGSETYLKSLTDRQVEAISIFLTEQRVADKRVSLRSFGSAKPLFSNREAAGRQKNRRVEFWRAELLETESSQTPQSD